MRTLIKLVIALALLAAIAYGALYGYLWHNLQKEAEAIVVQAKPVAEVSYKKISLAPTLDGTLEISGIAIKPLGVDDTIAIQSIKVSYPDVLALLKSVIERDTQPLPDQLRIGVSGLSVDLNGPLMTAYDKGMKAAQAQSPAGGHQLAQLLNFDALGCGNVPLIGFDEMYQMGYQKLELDSDLEYHYAKLQDDITFSLLLRARGMYSIDIKGVAKGLPMEVVKGKEALPRIKELRVDYVDSGYTMLRNRFCAAQINATEEDFKSRHIEAMSQVVDASFPAENVESYRKFLEGNGRITVTVAPQAGADMGALGGYSLQQALEPMRIGFMLNNKEINLKALDWGKRYNLEVAREQREEKLARERGETSTPESSKKPQFRATAVAQLQNHVGSHVQLTIVNGELREGVLDSVEQGAVTIRVYHAKGKGFISYTILLADIASARVFY